MAAAANIKIFWRIKKKNQLDIGGGSYCSICGKKLKNFPEFSRLSVIMKPMH